MKKSDDLAVTAETDPPRHSFLSARALRNPNLSPEELEAAETEAFEWAKRVNRC